MPGTDVLDAVVAGDVYRGNAICVMSSGRRWRAYVPQLRASMMADSVADGFATARVFIDAVLEDNKPPEAYIDPTATVHPTATVGCGTKVWGNAYIGPGAVVGEDCMVGRTVEVGAGVVIGDRCKLEAGCQVHPGWTLAEEVFVGPCAVFCNDNAPQAVRAPDAPFVPLEGRVGAGAVICANCTIIGGLTIGAGAKVWPGATVTGDVPAAYSARTPVAVNKQRLPVQEIG
jgi:UDP-2-acetamido-3-amino-2,3-dideoxy-glucuronate N-acetyltransferase